MERVSKTVQEPFLIFDTTTRQPAEPYRHCVNLDMSTLAKLESETRATLGITMKAIAHLDATLRSHLDEEIAVLSLIETLERKLKETREQHKHIIASITSIRQSRTQMNAVENSLRRTLSPIKVLPEEILLHIFRMTTEEADRALYTHAESCKIPPRGERYPALVLGGVCASWRLIVASNLCLWVTASVSLARLCGTSAGVRSREHQAASRSLRIGQSHLRSLFVYGWHNQRGKSMLELLGPDKADWKAISLCILGEDVESWNMSHLRAQNLTIYRVGMVELRFLMPLMRHATMLSIYGPPPSWGTLPWIRLRSLTIKSYAKKESSRRIPLVFGPEHFVALLVAATEITHLVLDFTIDQATLASNDSTSITHHNILSLSLHLEHFVSGRGPFGTQLNAPSLQTLDFISLHRKPSGDDAPFLMQWDDPKILSLSTMDDDEVFLAAELTKWLPKVHTIEVVGGNVDALFTFIHSLLHYIPPQSHPLPLPKLASLFITDSDLRGETLIQLLENKMRHVRGKTPNVCAITDIKMYNSPAVTVAHWSSVQELLRQGRSSGMHG